jgi:hypothetical protein
MSDPQGDSSPILRPVWPSEKATERMRSDDPEFISIPEWARRMGISADSAYRAARLGQIPGCFAIGRLYRINWTVFVQRAGDEPVAGPGPGAEEKKGAAGPLRSGR